MELTILAGNTAKIPFRGIPGIARIPPDSAGFRQEYVEDCKELVNLHCIQIYFQYNTQVNV